MSDAYAATLDPRQAPPGDALAGRPAAADPLDADFRQNIADQRQLMQDQARTAQDRERVLEPLRQDQLQQLRRTMPQPPQPQQLPPAPKRNEPGADESWLMVAGVLGAIAGGMTRNHTTNALAAMTGAMEGYNEGSRQKFDENIKIWDAETKRVLETNQQANEQYKQVLETQKLAFQQKMEEIQLTAAKYDDRAAMQLAQQGNAQKLGDLIEKRSQLQVQMSHYDAQLRQQYAQFQQRERFQTEKMELERQKLGQGQEQADEARAKAISEYQLPPVVNPRQPRDRAVMNRVLEINPQYDAREYNASNRATTQFATGPQGNTIRSLNVAISHLDTLEQLGQALQTGNSQFINQAKNAFRQQFGQDAPTNFNAAKQIVGAEIIKGVVATGGGVTEREEAARVISAANSPAQLRGVIATYKQLLAGQLEGLKKQYEDTTKRSDFDTRLTPQAKKELGGAGPAPASSAPAANTRDLGGGWSVQISP